VIGKAPTFDGEVNVEGFLRDFDIWQKDKKVDVAYRYSALRNALRAKA
jgi:Retrotransposon gag protein